LHILLRCTRTGFCSRICFISALFSLGLFELFTYSNWHVFSFYLSILNTGKCVSGDTTHAFALVEEVQRYSESRILRLRLYLAGEYSHLNTNNVESCPRLFNMRSHIRGTNAPLYFLKVTRFVLYFILARCIKFIFKLS
jgi:hypothetical protein